jgi:hypothetical protein
MISTMMYPIIIVKLNARMFLKISVVLIAFQTPVPVSTLFLQNCVEVIKQYIPRYVQR